MRIVKLIAAAAIMAASIAAPAHAGPDTADETAILKALQDSCDSFKLLNLTGAMALYAPDLHLFDMSPPQQRNYADLKEALRQMIAAIAAPPTCGYRDMYIKVYGDNAYAHYVMPFHARLTDGRTIDFEGRGTNLFERSAGKWLVVHEHLSLPVDMSTGQAEMKPPLAP